jgi:DNA-binding CsgD family transcriptional regulator
VKLTKIYTFGIRRNKHFKQGNELLTDKEYTQLTKNVIRGFVKNRRVRSFMLRDEDLFNEIKYKIMLGDTEYDPTKKAAPQSYRIQCGIWAIKKIYSAMQKGTNHISLDSENNETELTLADTIEDRQQYKFLTQDELMNICTSANLNDNQLNVVLELFSGAKIKEIADKMQVTKTMIYNHIAAVKHKIKMNNVKQQTERV